MGLLLPPRSSSLELLSDDVPGPEATVLGESREGRMGGWMDRETEGEIEKASTQKEPLFGVS